jgi:hypothetical protein
VRNWMTAAIVATGVAGVAAQAIDAPRPEDVRAHTAQQRETGAITGCLIRAAEPDQYLLTVVLSRDDERAAPGVAGAVGTSGTSSADAADPMADSAAYRLAPSAGVELSAHVGKTVEVVPAMGAADVALPVERISVVAERCE